MPEKGADKNKEAGLRGIVLPPKKSKEKDDFKGWR